MSHSSRKAFLYLFIVFTLWGSLYVVSGFVMGKIPTFTACFLRFVIAFGALTLMTRGREKINIEKSDYKYLLLMGILGYFLSVDLQFLGTKYAGSGMASLLNSLNPIVITILSAFLLKEKMTFGKILGMFLSVTGVYLILGGGSAVSKVGIMLSLMSVAGWSFMSVMTRKALQKYDSLQITRYGIMIAMFCNFPVCMCELHGNVSAVTFDFPCIIGLLYMGIFCTGVSYILWNKSLMLLEAGTCSAFYPVQPLVSTVLGILFLHEKTTVSFVVGASFIVVGILSGILIKRNPAGRYMSFSDLCKRSIQ
ncbi:MAG: DMT family transporter [Clostridiales bacterium]|nr:DMT family transporter [Clostridiales bacterium]